MQNKPYKNKIEPANKVNEPVAEAIKSNTETENCPEGYLTIEEFRVSSDKMIDKLFKKHGLL